MAAAHPGVAALLGAAPVVESEGRSFPVETRYLDKPPGDDIARETASLVRRALDEEGVNSVAEMDARVRTDLQTQAERMVLGDYQDEIVDLLVATASLDYPEVLVDREIDRIIDRESNHASHSQEGLNAWLGAIVGPVWSTRVVAVLGLVVCAGVVLYAIANFSIWMLLLAFVLFQVNWAAWDSVKRS